MTNAKTNSYLPAAPSARGKFSILHSAYCTVRHCAFRILHSAFVIAAVAAMTAATASAITVTMSKITSTGGGDYTADPANNKILFNVIFPDSVISVSDTTPYLTLNGFLNTTGAQATYKELVQEGTKKGMRFEYTVQPGDFSSGVGVAGFNRAGATILYGDPDEPDTVTAANLPAAGNILNGETITIRTITFADGSTTKAAGTLYKGDELVVEITRGGNVSASQAISLSASTGGKVTMPEAVTIAANESSVSCTLTLAAATDGPITITCHPANYNGDAGDLTLTLTIVEATKPYIVAVHNDGEDKTYSVGETIHLAVEVNDEIDSVSGAPLLVLDILNQDTTAANRSATFVEYEGKFLNFDYVVKAGDFSEDLDCVSKGFNMNGATITINGKNLDRTGRNAMPVGATEGSLSQNAAIVIATITLDDYTLARDLSGREGDRLSVEITRREPSIKVQGFDIKADQEGKVDWTANFSIPRNEESAFLDIDLVEATTTPLTLTIHPNGYTKNGSDITAGDIVLTIDIATGTKPPIIIDGPTQLEEGSGITTLNISLPRPPKETTTVQIASDSTKLELLGNTSLVWAPNSQDAKTVSIRPLDGDAQVNITATTTSTSYSDGSLSIYVINRNPTLISPPEDWKPAGGGEGFPYTVGWSGTDVTADKDTLYAMITWGDGTARERHDGAQGSASHIYNVAGTWGITIELYDKDGGVAAVSGEAEIAAAVTITINEYKARIPEDVGQNAYKGLQGLGRGSIDDDLAETALQNVTRWIDWKIKYSPFVASARLIATPERFDFQGMNSYGAAGTYTFDSFFHVWLGDEDTFLSKWCLVPLSAPVTAGIGLRDGETATDRQVGGVFSREHYPEDGCADIDWDELPDGWETLVWPGTELDPLPFESTALPYGRDDNPDNDFFPACVTGIDAETGAINFEGCDFTPVGIPFINVYEVRGTHRGLNMDPTRTPIIGTTNIDYRTVVTVTVPAGEDPDNEAIWLSSTTDKVATDNLDPLLGDATQGAWVLLDGDDDTETYSRWTEETTEPVTIYAAEPVDPQDEPHCGSYDKDGVFTDNGAANKFYPWYGTDPTNPDTDGDKLTDGY